MSQLGAIRRIDMQADQVMEIDLAIRRRGRLLARHEQVAAAPQLGQIAIRDLLKSHDPSALERDSPANGHEVRARRIRVASDHLQWSPRPAAA